MPVTTRRWRGVWKAGSEGRCSRQRRLGGLAEPEAASRQRGRFGRQELKVVVGTAGVRHGFVREGPGRQEQGALLG